MNRTELVQSVAETTGLDRRHAEAAVIAMTDAVIKEIRAGNKVSIFDFGTFKPTARAARMGRNPQTGAPVRVAASKSVRFTPAASFKAALNSRTGAKKAAAKKAAAKKAPAAKAPAKKAPAKKAAKTAKKS